MDNEIINNLAKLKSLYSSVNPTQPIQVLWDKLPPKLTKPKNYSFFSPLKYWLVAAAILVLIFLTAILIISPSSHRYLTPIKKTSLKISETQPDSPLITPKLENVINIDSVEFDNLLLSPVPAADTSEDKAKTEITNQMIPSPTLISQPLKKSTQKKVNISPTPSPLLKLTSILSPSPTPTPNPTQYHSNKKSKEKKNKKQLNYLWFNNSP